ncbi:MAG TPA: hypothetical protein VK324_17440 [Tepidisphaeraceae bacterium]|nr:hypothetical protein [Tepidisphaeraceae bacterium]
MKPLVTPLIVLSLLSGCASRADKPAAPSNRADALAAAVAKASGAEAWAGVKRLRFTFYAAGGDKPTLSARHDWDVPAGKDTITWAGKTVTVDVNAPPPADAPKDVKDAFARWTNDAYWLVAPLKWLDPGVNRAYGGTQTVYGQSYEVLNLSFGPVGLTSNDRYTVYVDPRTNLVRYWDYMPAPDKTLRGTWEKYQTFNGLTLSTDHEIAGRRITFTDVSVER